MAGSPLAFGTPIRRLVSSLRRDGIVGLATTFRRGIEWRLNRWRPPAPPEQDVGVSADPLIPAPGPTGVVPRVAVIVTARNREELLPVALRSVQLQEFRDFECIIVDDASTDDSAAVAQRFAEADSRFRVIVHDVRRGSSAARNTGVAEAFADLVCFLDDDDFLLRDSLSARFDRMERAPGHVAGAYCDWVSTAPGVGLEVFDDQFKPAVRRTVTFSRLRLGTPFIVTSPLMRRTVIELVGGFREDMENAEDADFWFRVCRRGFSFRYVAQAGVAYRRSPGSKVLGDPRRQLLAMSSVFAEADGRAPEGGLAGPLPVRESMQELASAADRSGQIYRYLALVALEDVDSAISLGRDLLPDAVRAEIDPPALTERLVVHVVAKTLIEGRENRFDADQAMHRLVAGLLPTYAERWDLQEPRDETWAERRERGETLKPPPDVVKASDVSVEGSIVLVPEALYHIDELGPLYRELSSRGQRVHFMLSPITVPSAHAALGRYTDTVLAFDEDVGERAAALVVLNDWSRAKGLLRRANQHDVPIFAKVEGVQDFNDDDTGIHRSAYRTASVILGQGDNDVAALPDQRVEVVGSTRLERIWSEGPIDRTESVLVNLNFTFRVLTEYRDSWIGSVRDALRESGLVAGVSLHPAERTTDVGIPIVEKRFRHAITESGVLVSRFSTVPFEAMARGVPFIYHNPHGEKVPTFQTPRGAFRVTTNSHELAHAMRSAVEGDEGREKWEQFFRAQIDIDPHQPSESRAADVIEKFLG